MLQMITAIMAAIGLMAGPAQATWSETLKCGKCIKGGYTFCFQGNDSQQFTNATELTYKCCQDATCPVGTMPTYTCSKSYSDTDYALTFCPFKKDKCGDVQNVTFDKVNQTQDMKVKGLKAGESCTYMAKSKCGSPAFKFKNLKNVTSDEFDKVDIRYIEYEKNYTTGGDDDTAGDTSDSKMNKRPSYWKPNRNQSWSDQGLQNVSCTNCTKEKDYGNGTQYLPPRKKKSSGDYTNQTDMGKYEKQKREFLKSQNAKEAQMMSASDIDFSSTGTGGDDGTGTGGDDGTGTGGDDGTGTGGDGTGGDGSSTGGDGSSTGGGSGNSSDGTNGYYDGYKGYKSYNKSYYEEEQKEKQEKYKRRSECDSDRCKKGNETDKARKRQIKDTRNDTESETGYGKPSKGKYGLNISNYNSSGYKTFGTKGQGNSTYGARELNSSKCRDRVMLVTITADEDLDDLSEMTVSFGNYEFLEDMSLEDMVYSVSAEKANFMNLSVLKIAFASLIVFMTLS